MPLLRYANWIAFVLTLASVLRCVNYNLRLTFCWRDKSRREWTIMAMISSITIKILISFCSNSFWKRAIIWNIASKMPENRRTPAKQLDRAQISHRKSSLLDCWHGGVHTAQPWTKYAPILISIQINCRTQLIDCNAFNSLHVPMVRTRYAWDHVCWVM